MIVYKNIRVITHHSYLICPFRPKQFDRSGKNITVDQHKLPKTVSARHVRFIPSLQHVWNCLKVEVYGFDGKHVIFLTFSMTKKY